MTTRTQAKRCDEPRGEVTTGTRGGAPKLQTPFSAPLRSCCACISLDGMHLVRPPADCTATTHAAVSDTCLPRLHIPNDRCRLVAPVLKASAKLRTSVDVSVYRPLDVLRSHSKT